MLQEYGMITLLLAGVTGSIVATLLGPLDPRLAAVIGFLAGVQIVKNMDKVGKRLRNDVERVLNPRNKATEAAEAIPGIIGMLVAWASGGVWSAAVGAPMGLAATLVAMVKIMKD